MKSVIALGPGRSLVIDKCGQGVSFDITVAGMVMGGAVLTAEDAAVLILSVRLVLEALAQPKEPA